MSVFDDIKLEWKGRQVVIPSNRVMGAIVRIEDIITLQELAGYVNDQRAPIAKLAMAYAAVLRYGGAKVEDDEVYAGIFPGGSDSKTDIVTAVTSLLTMMVPRHMVQDGTEETPKGNSPPAAARSGKNYTKRRSATVG